MDVPRNDEPRLEPGIHRKFAAIRYELLSLVSHLTGSVFWWSEQRRWAIADKLEELEAHR